LVLKKGKFGKFIACDTYPTCTATFKLPTNGLTQVTDKVCDVCTHPVILIIKKAKKPQEVCINPDCPKKVIDVSSVVGTKCPKCGQGKLLVRKSVYGQFIACDAFPKCRYIQKAERVVKNAETPKLTGPAAQLEIGMKKPAPQISATPETTPSLMKIVNPKPKKTKAKKK
jgi:ssDNA-binding Zn-finger/Zn-ribbon topoisomerase 1